MQLECSLSTFPLRELLELCIRSMITGAVDVDAPDGSYRVFVRGGRIYHAESPSETGLDALWPLFDLTDGRFRFRAGLSSRERTIDERPASLLTRAQRLAAEWRTIRPAIASLDVVPQLVVPENIETVRIDEEYWTVLCLADGMRTIREIAAEAGVEHVDVCRVLIRLHKRGLVSLDRQRPREPRLSTRLKQPLFQAAGDEANSSTFFARLLAALPPDQVATTTGAAGERAQQIDAIVHMLNAQ
jgi:hypothetical protein